MNDTDADLELRFGALLKPIRDLTKNWEIDLSTYLEPYLQEVQSQEISINFAEAALLLQGSASVYSKKVEYVAGLANNLREFLAIKSRSKEDSSDAGKSEKSKRSRILRGFEEFALVTNIPQINPEIDDLPLNPPKDPLALQKLCIIPMPIELIRVSNPRDMMLFDTKDELAGRKLDFRINQVSTWDSADQNISFVVHEIFKESDTSSERGAPADDFIGDDVMCDEDVDRGEEEKPAVSGDHQGGEDGESRVGCDSPSRGETSTRITITDKSSRRKTACGPIELEVEDTLSRSGRKRKQAIKMVMDFHFAKNKRMSKGKQNQENEGVKTERRGRKRKIEQEQLGETTTEVKQEDDVTSLGEEKGKTSEEEREEVGNASKSVQQTPVVDHDVDSDHDDNDDGYFDQAIGAPSPDESVLEFESRDLSSQSKQKNNDHQEEDDLEQRAQRALDEDQDALPLDDLGRRVREWENRIRPILDVEAKRETFNMRTYGRRIREALVEASVFNKSRQSTESSHGGADESSHAGVLPIEGLCAGAKPEPWQVARTFVATLQLANMMNVELNSSGEINDVTVRLSDRDWVKPSTAILEENGFDVTYDDDEIETAVQGDVDVGPSVLHSSTTHRAEKNVNKSTSLSPSSRILQTPTTRVGAAKGRRKKRALIVDSDSDEADEEEWQALLEGFPHSTPICASRR